MPAGKAAVAGGTLLILPLPYGVNIRSMRRHSKPNAQTLSVSELKNYRKALRFAFKIYRIDCARPAPTGTERQKTLGAIKSAARRFADSGKPLWADRLLTALDTPDLDARRLAYRALQAKGYPPIEVKRMLVDVYARHASPDACLLPARALADIEIAELSPTGGRFPDPGLAKLVTALIPVWERVTGRTAGLTSVDEVGDQKTSRFAAWLCEQCSLLEIELPPVGRVVDIVRFSKN